MINFREPEDSDAELTLRWRLAPHIARMMISHVDNDINKQVEWLNYSRGRSDYYHWIFQKDEIDIGMISILLWPTDINAMHVGIYIAESRFSYLGLQVLQLTYSYIFSIQNKNLIHIICKDDNPIIKIQKYFGFERNMLHDRTHQHENEVHHFLGFSLDKSGFTHFAKTIPILPVNLRNDKDHFYLS